MNYPQYRRMRKLVHECCNYDNGNCILLDDEEECVCVQSISYSLLCKWFRCAVLPLDKPLETALLFREELKRCVVCGQSFLPGSNRAKYLPFPRFLVPMDLSNDAKVLYALLLDRTGISRENGYIEPDGRIRLYFTLEEAKGKLHRSRQVATRAFQELERRGLILRRKQGLGRPAVITLNILPAGKERDGIA